MMLNISRCTLSRVVSVVFWGAAFSFAVGIIPNPYALTTLEPGSGGFIIQAIVVSALAVLLAIRVFGARITGTSRKDSLSSPSCEQ